ncbi:MAG: F0F1 ATP synthase subunit B' [Thermosynechococcaceae cyanobacterium MS004]|nr:F0F1 ATP synthase subunit B' [Thermosynechococcaceae cyanobacterium MS004]
MFDFDATLPLVAIQFLLLVVVLNAVFFKPLSKVLSDRQDYVSSNNTEARERQDKAKRLAQDYSEKLSSSRRQSQTIITDAQTAAQKQSSAQVAEAQRKLQEQATSIQLELEQQKQAAFSALEKEVDTLSQQLLKKLLGPELAR